MDKKLGKLFINPMIKGWIQRRGYYDKPYDKGKDKKLGILL